ncbi:CaiB/BaiF CoA transferase family protein [Diplocloster modestus]|uniref:CoA transferase n=1 Tax=Diplocloster modestus TaxID=2850322 RepID=A0ABS6K6T2_9FIRM|nr:CoA transferase [Diplocloster modestus]MBU9726241.1 CoA transferase [Diplocloster modestus]
MLDLLKGMKVIEIAGFMAAPTAGRILGEWGANVIKVEPPQGDSTRGVGISRHILNGDQAGFDCFNACKTYVALDTRKPEGMEILKKMLKDADVFISHLKIKDAIKLGLDYETLKEDHPKLICASTSGYGLAGAWATRGGFDGVSYAARCGYVKDCPVEGDTPMVPYFGFGDIPTGTYLAMAILAAYVRQQRTGQGEKINVALMHAGMWSANVPVVSSIYGDQYPTDPNTVHPLAKPYLCKDGKWIGLMGLDWQRTWPVFVKAVGLPEEYITTWVAYEDALAHAQEITPILKEMFLKEDRQYWVDKLINTPMPFDICQDFKDLQGDQQAWDAGFFQGIDYPSGMHVGIVKAPAIFKEAGTAEFQSSGPVGESTRDVLKELGYSDADVDRMREEKLILEGDQWDPQIYNMERYMKMKK